MPIRNSELKRRLLPLPRSLAGDGTAVRFSLPLEIRLSPKARRLEPVLEELFSRRGIPVSVHELPVAEEALCVLACGRGVRAEIFSEVKQALDRIETRWPEQAYVLKLAPHAVVGVSRERAGLFYALQTLLQLYEREGSWPGGVITDAPALGYRGLLWDVSRGQVPTLETLKTLVDFLAGLKLNLLTFNLEHTFAWRKHPALGRGHDPLTAEEIRELVAYARARQVEVVPAQQSLGHLSRLFQLPEYRHLAYDPEALWSLDPTRPESYQLLEELYEELIPCFDSDWFNVCCDEPFDLARRFDAARFGGKSFGQVYLEHLLRLRAILERHGKTMLVWGDVVLAHPEILRELPREVIVLDWKYGSGAMEGPEHYRPGLELLAGSGHRFFTCTCSWNLMKIFTHLDLLAQNHRAFVPEGISAGAIGNLLTHWGDLGHMSLLGPTLPALALAAEWSWTGQERDAAELDLAYSRVLFADEAGRAAKLMRRLHQVNRILAGPAGLGDIGFLVFFEEPLSGDLSRGISDPADKAAQLQALAEQASVELQKLAASNLKNRRWLKDLELSIAQIRVLARKLSLLGRFQVEYPGLASAEAGTAEEVLCGLADGYQQLASLIQAAGEILEERWLDQAKRSDLDQNLVRYQRLVTAALLRSQQFEAIWADYLAGKGLPSPGQVVWAPEFAKFKFDALAEMGIKHLLMVTKP